MALAEAPARQSHGDIMEQVLMKGDMSKLTAEERTTYCLRVCESLGLNPLTRPFEWISLSGKLTLYAKRDATDQLRALRNVSVTIVSRERLEDVYIVTARATTPDGRSDESIGAVSLGKLTGEALANALMKCETKSKRRVTLSICGLGFLDETEVETVPYSHGNAEAATRELHTGTVPTPDQRDARDRAIDDLIQVRGQNESVRQVLKSALDALDIHAAKPADITADDTVRITKWAIAQAESLRANQTPDAEIVEELGF